jgi:general secretion pathway protein I
VGRQHGFTLIEVAVAFAIFAMCIGALYESFAGAMRRSAQARELEFAWLQAQSILSQQRVRPAPWEAERTGEFPAGLVWKVETDAFDVGLDERSSWRAYQVTVRVHSQKSSTRKVTLKSIELARSFP